MTERVGMATPLQPDLQLPKPTLNLGRMDTTGPTVTSRQRYARGDLSGTLAGRHDTVVDDVDIWGLVDFERTTWELGSVRDGCG
jgi:hypothetical protein